MSKSNFPGFPLFCRLHAVTFHDRTCSLGAAIRLNTIWLSIQSHMLWHVGDAFFVAKTTPSNAPTASASGTSFQAPHRRYPSATEFPALPSTIQPDPDTPWLLRDPSEKIHISVEQASFLSATRCFACSSFVRPSAAKSRQSSRVLPLNCKECPVCAIRLGKMASIT